MEAMAIAALAAAAAPNKPKAVPTGIAATKWQVDFGDKRCVAARKFQVGSREVVLAIEPNPDGDGVRVLFSLPDGQKEVAAGPIPGALLINGKEVAKGLTQWPAEGKGLLLIAGAGSEETGAPFTVASISEVGVRSAKLNASLPLNGVAKVAGLLDQCNRGLLEGWGFSQAEQDRLQHFPKMATPIRRLFSSDDYPHDSVRSGQQGEVRVRLAVDAEGRVTQCAVRYSSGWPLLDAATCGIIQRRARFEPARDKQGNAMAAPAFSTVRWMMP